jgi:hypothetical protein
MQAPEEARMTEKQQKFRSPPYPYVGLGKALSKAEQLYGAVRHHAAALPTAAKAWETGLKSSATLQSAAALIQYGLLDGEGSGDSRKVKLTPLALKIVMDKRPESAERVEALKEAALSPKIFAELFARYGTAEGIDDTLLVHTLTAERVQLGKAPYSEESAAEVIRVYRDTMAYAGLSDSDTETDEGEAPEAPETDTSVFRVAAKVGEFVQWVPGGVAQFAEPKRVRAVSDDGDWAFVEGSKTGIAMYELEVVQAPKAGRAPPVLPLPEDEPTVYDRADPRDKDRMKVVWEGSLIHISATVDRLALTDCVRSWMRWRRS